jgi:phage tail-like protein
LKQGTLTAQQRLSALIDEPELEHGTSEFLGSATSGAQVYSAKLFDVRQPYLWVWLTLRAAPGARLPAISELAVLYPGRTLMENLPAIYRAEEDRPGSFVRTLVGVLETTTQGLDARIGALGSHIHPATASEPWLDYVARWLGVPWDDAFSVEQKRAVISHAAELAKSRGTRAGLETLLACLISGSPRRFRVTDATADFGFAIVGGATCRGSQLPAMLAGTRSRAELGTRAVLGHVRLPCSDDSEDDAARLCGLIRIEVAATGKERLAWQPWLPSIIAEMLPLGARMELHWVSSQALRGDRLDGALTLSSAPLTLLDSAAVLGLSRLPETDTRLSSTGPTLSTRLR